MVGMASMETHASECLPALNSFTCGSWHSAQVSGVGMRTLATSLLEVWPSPWQSAQMTSFSQWRLMLQSATTPGVIFSWQGTQDRAAAEGALVVARTEVADANDNRPIKRKVTRE